MNLDFPFILLSLTVFTGLITLCYKLFRRQDEVQSYPKLVEYSRSFFPIFLIVLIIRSFLVQPYQVPTGSLEPTILPGEFLFANQYQFGLRFPVWRNSLIAINGAERGQIFLFHDPVNPQVILIKRLIGMPGDKISYINKVLYINGKEMTQKKLGNAYDIEGNTDLPVEKYQENLDGVIHNILINPKVPAQNFYNLTVPKGYYFAMGDNRDNSDDSRYWGFVPEHNLIGKGMIIWLSWNSDAAHWYDKIRWHRIGTIL